MRLELYPSPADKSKRACGITASDLKGMNRMRCTKTVALTVTLLISGATSAQEPAQYAAADIRVMSPGVVYNAGLLDLAASYTKETGKKVVVTSVGMGSIVNAGRTANPSADVIMLPFELMSTLSLDGGVVPATFSPLGRSEMGLAVRAGAAHP